MYGSSGNGNGNDSGVRNNRVGCDSWAKRTDPALDLVSDSYSELDVTSSIRASSTLFVHLTLSTDYLSYCSTSYYPNKH